jgi:hypothetical protein
MPIEHNQEITIDQSSIPPYTIVPNYVIHNKSILPETKLTIIYLLSRTNIPGWKVHPFDIQEMCGFKRSVWLKVSKQLKSLGLLRETKVYQGTILTFTFDWKKL